MYTKLEKLNKIVKLPIIEQIKFSNWVWMECGDYMLSFNQSSIFVFQFLFPL